MTTPTKDEIRKELQGAVETLDGAEILLERGIRHMAVSGAYYAIPTSDGRSHHTRDSGRSALQTPSG